MEIKVLYKQNHISIFFRNGAKRNVVFAPGFPQYVSQYNPFVNTLNELECNVFIAKYLGSYENEGKFNIKNSKNSVENTIELVKAGEVVQLYDGTIVKWDSKLPLTLIGFSFGGYVSLSIDSDKYDRCICICPFLGVDFHKDFEGENIQESFEYIRKSSGRLFDFDIAELINSSKSLPSAKWDISKITVVSGLKDWTITSDEVREFSKLNKLKFKSYNNKHTANLSEKEFGEVL